MLRQRCQCITYTKYPKPANLELVEALGRLVLGDTEDVETDSLGERTALTDGDGVTLLDTERGGDVGGEVLVALLVTAVLGDEVEVLAAEDDGVGHLARGVNDTSEDTATDRDLAGEGALLVDVSAVDGLCEWLAQLIMSHHQRGHLASRKSMSIGTQSRADLKGGSRSDGSFSITIRPCNPLQSRFNAPFQTSVAFRSKTCARLAW